MASVLSLIWALVLLGMILFVIGIFITQVVTNHRKDESPTHSNFDPELDEALDENFGSLITTMYSLYQAITGGNDWGAFSEPLFEVSGIIGVFFCLYIAFAVFAVLNVVTGVFVDNAIKANANDADMIIIEQTEARKKHIEEVKGIFHKADRDGSGYLNIEEFNRHVDNPYVQAYFRHLDLDVEGAGGSAVFHLLDFDSNGLIDIDEFIFGAQHLKGYARSLDLARVGHGLRSGQMEFTAQFNVLCKEQNALLTQIKDMMTNKGSSIDRSESNKPMPLENPVNTNGANGPASPPGPPPNLPGCVQSNQVPKEFDAPQEDLV